MATFAILGELAFNTEAKRDTVLAKITTFLADKPAWGNKVAIASNTWEDGQPSIHLEIRFTERPNLDNLFDLAETELNKLQGVKATFSKHICRHDEGTIPCVIEELATVVR